MAWQLQEAKQKFSELVQRALREGPQEITRHGETVAFVVSAGEYRKLTEIEPDFADFLLSAPDLSVLDLERSSDLPPEHRTVSYLLDTNVLLEARKPTGNPKARAWLTSVRGTDLFLSALVVGEIRQGIERLRRRDPAQAGVYEVWLTTLRRDYADRILPITADVAEEWGRLTVPDPVPSIDGLIAATALVTRNTADFARTGVRLINPFEG